MTQVITHVNEAIESGHISMIVRLSRRSSGMRLLLDYSFSTVSFSEAVSTISGRSSEHEPMTSMTERIKVNDVTESLIKNVSDQVIQWGSSQSEEQLLQVLHESERAITGQKQLYHLAALALAGEYKKLESYQNTYEREAEPIFVPMIKKAMIDRAVILSKRYG